MSTAPRTTAKLSTKTIARLRGLGHALAPVVQIGKEGLSAAVIAQTNSALTAHELIKVKLASESPLDRHDTATELAGATKAELVQVIGRAFVLFRASAKKKKNKIDLAALTAKPNSPTEKKRTKKKG